MGAYRLGRGDRVADVDHLLRAETDEADLPVALLQG